MLGRALKDHLGYKLQHPFLDVADIAPMLCPQAHIREAGLDEWIDWFKLEVFERHNASADALATAELALILFSRARQQQIDSPLNLQQRLSQWKRRQRTPSF
jgi:DNA polymerase-3 subunit epsilon